MKLYFNFHPLKQTLYLLKFGLLAHFLLFADSNLTDIKHAETHFAEKLYGDAIPLYSHLFNLAQDKELKIQWAQRLATCFIEENQPRSALALLSSLDPHLRLNHTLYLISLAYRQLGQSPQALNVLQQYPLCYAKDEASIILLEQGYHLMQIGDFIHAQKILNEIDMKSCDPISYPLAQMQLAKISLINHHPDEALQILNRIPHFLSQPPSLEIAKIYLKGWIHLARKDDVEAASCFETLLSKALTSQSNWSIDVLNGLIASNLKQTIKITDTNQLNQLFSKTESLLDELIKRSPTEASYLLLSDFYLIKAKSLSDPDSYAKAEQLLDQIDLFSSTNGLREALLKRAAAAPSYLERDQRYEQLSTSPSAPLEFRAKVLFFKGLNDLEEGIRNQKATLTQQNGQFEKAAHALTQSIQLEKGPSQTHKYLIHTYLHLPQASYTELAWQLLDQLIANDNFLFSLEHPEEIYCLSAWIALRLAHSEALQKARSLIQQHPTTCPFWQERYLKLEGLLSLQLGDWQQADRLFDCLSQNITYASSRGEALFWRAHCAGKQQQEALRKGYLEQVYTQYSQSPFAPIAYFHYYCYRDYMHGKRKAIKHLQAMPFLFPDHKLLINAYYLIGLYHKKDSLSEEGKILRRKDWTSAIAAFELTETIFETLIEKNEIPSADIHYFTHIRYQAQLERAQANFAIAKNSIGGKKEIYLKYTKEVLYQLIQDFTDPETLAKKVLVQPNSPYPHIWAEAELELAKTYEEKNEWKERENILNDSLKHYHQAHITKGYRLMRTWVEKGKLARLQGSPQSALHHFLEAEKAIQEHSTLSPNEKLDLWIQQSLCYKELNKLEQSMRILSQVINDDVISPLRIKAMFLRAEIYELQGRPELAMKQLEAIAHKGGGWSQQAKEKLEKSYGY